DTALAANHETPAGCQCPSAEAKELRDERPLVAVPGEGRIGEDQIDVREPRQYVRERQRVHHQAARVSEVRGVRPQRRKRVPSGLDRYHASRAAAERLEGERARPGAAVDDDEAVQALSEPVEERLLYAIRERTCLETARGNETPTSEGTTDDAQRAHA